MYVTEYAGSMQRLLRMSTDPRTGEIKGEPETLLPAMNISSPAASNAGDRLMYKQQEDISNLLRVSFDIGANSPEPEFTQLTSQTSQFLSPRISPNGELVAFTMAFDSLHVCILPTDGETWTQLTHTSIVNVPIDWSPDGKRIAYISFEDFNSTEFAYKILDIEGGRLYTVCTLPMSHARNEAWVGSWSRDGRLVVTDGTCSRLWLIDIETGDIEKVPVAGSEGVILEPYVSPDGDLAAFYWNREDDKTDGIWTVSLDDFSEELVAEINARVFGWGPDGDWVYIWCRIDEEKELGRIHVGTGTIQWLARIDRLTDRNSTWIDLSPDGTWAVFADLQPRADLWIVEDFDPHVR
jgi:Tol biopolymer transport system component